MLKLMICANRCGQSTPKVRAMSWTGPPSAAAASNTRLFILKNSGWAPNEWSSAQHGRSWFWCLDQEERVEHDRFGKSDGQNGLDQDLRRRAGIAPDRFRGFHADEAYTKGRAQRRKTDVSVTRKFR